jgi:hypothetical protein
MTAEIKVVKIVGSKLNRRYLGKIVIIYSCEHKNHKNVILIRIIESYPLVKIAKAIKIADFNNYICRDGLLF